MNTPMKRMPKICLMCIFFCTISQLQAALIQNGSFESGTFAAPGDPNFQNFAPGYIGTLVRPGETKISNWNVSFSPFDPDQAFTFLNPNGPFGLEWAQGAIENERWVDLNRGGDLWRVSQNIATNFGTTYQISFDLLIGNVMGGAVIRTQVDGATSSFFDYTAEATGPPRWKRISHVFTASSSVTNLQFMALSVGLDTASGPQMDKVDVVVVPEPAAWICTFIFCAFSSFQKLVWGTFIFYPKRFLLLAKARGS
jgi:hypothetical protein